MKIKLIVFLTTAVIALAQPPPDQSLDRSFNLNHVDTPRDMQEIATVVRSIGDAKQVAAEVELKVLTVHGTADEMAVTKWLLEYLDLPDIPANTPNSPKRRYQMPAGKNGDNVIGVFYLPQMETLQSFQEVSTVVRSIGEIRRLFTYSARRAIVARGTPEQIDLAEWLLNELEQPAAAATPGKREYIVPGPGDPDNIVRVFSLKQSATPQRFQEIATQVRVTTQARRLFTYLAPRIITVRGTPGQVEHANQLITELNR